MLDLRFGSLEKDCLINSNTFVLLLLKVSARMKLELKSGLFVRVDDIKKLIGCSSSDWLRYSEVRFDVNLKTLLYRPIHMNCLR